MQLKISIVTPNFNGADLLERAIRSVIAQDYRDIEHIVMDGGSSDGSLQIVEKHRDHLARFVSETDQWPVRRDREGILTGNGRYSLLVE